MPTKRVWIAAIMLVAIGWGGPAFAGVNVQINLGSQTMRVTAASGETYLWPISSARRGYVTPHGVYRAQRLVRMHYSRKYDNSPMPHAIFFRGGYAIHGTGAVGQLGRPASHGCIRLAPGNAATLFRLVQREGGARIVISGQPPDRATMMASRRARTVPIAYAPQQRPWAELPLRRWPSGHIR